MRTVLRQLMILASAIGVLAACEIPDDGYSEVSGTIRIPPENLALVVHPSDAGSTCDPEAENGWTDNPAIGDKVPAVYIGLYKRPLHPLQDNIGETNETTWAQGCGDIDHDDDPVTPTVYSDYSCPVGGTTAEFRQIVTGTDAGVGTDGAFFDFEALQLDKGTVYLWAWLDNSCLSTNKPSNSLVWDISGPPGPLDFEGNEEDDLYDLTIPSVLEVDIGSGGNDIGELVLSSALDLASLTAYEAAN